MKFRHNYILVGQTPVPEPDLDKWAQWFEAADRIVKQTEIPGGMVSTVFLGLDHQWRKGPPLLFETMHFADGDSVDCRRCSTWFEAERQHEAMVAGAIAKYALEKRGTEKK